MRREMFGERAEHEREARLKARYRAAERKLAAEVEAGRIRPEAAAKRLIELRKKMFE